MENQHENKTSHFFILIPSEVLTNTELSEGAKLLYGEILSLSVKNKYCFATNDYFMKLNGVSKRTIVSRLKELKNHNLIYTEVFRNANRQVERRNIYITKDFSISNSQQKQTYKTKTTAVKETGIDEVSQEVLDNLPF